jgi:hypothetical protein
MGRTVFAVPFTQTHIKGAHLKHTLSDMYRNGPTHFSIGKFAVPDHDPWNEWNMNMKFLTHLVQ